MQLGDAALGQFSNGEKSVEISISLTWWRGVESRLLCAKSRCVYCAVRIGDVIITAVEHVY